MHKISVTYFLIAVSFITTFLTYIFPGILFFGMSDYFITHGMGEVYLLQMLLYSFLHGGFLHLLMNSMFLYYFGGALELLIGRKKYIFFFIFATIFNGIFLTVFQGGANTIGISGFCMALLSYYVLELRARNNPEYKGGLTAIGLNILIGLLPGISLFGHLFGAIAGVIFYYINKDWFRPKFVGKVSKEGI